MKLDVLKEVMRGEGIRMVKCFFCGREEEPFKGIHLIKNDGSIQYFCSSKCRKNFLKLKRDRRTLKWTQAYRLEQEKNKAQIVRARLIDEKKIAEKKAAAK